MTGPTPDPVVPDPVVPDPAAGFLRVRGLFSDRLPDARRALPGGVSGRRPRGDARCARPDVVTYTDGGGRRAAAGRPLHSAAEVARLLLGVLRKMSGAAVVPRIVEADGAPGVVIEVDGVVDAVASAEVADGRITALHVIRNPDKLEGVRATSPRPADRAP